VCTDCVCLMDKGVRRLLVSELEGPVNGLVLSVILISGEVSALHGQPRRVEQYVTCDVRRDGLVRE